MNIGDRPNGPKVCPICRRFLKSGRHRGQCPGRRRRRGAGRPRCLGDG